MGKTAYITGADRGVGLALAKELLGKGWYVFAGQFLPGWPELQKLLKQYPDTLTVIPLDVRSQESVGEAAGLIKQKTGTLDLLINNAAIFSDRSGTITEKVYYRDMLEIYNTNSLGPLRVTSSVVDLIVKGQDKLLVNLSSEAGSISACWRKKEFGYSMSKAALNMQSAILYNDLSPLGVKVFAIHPGWVKSYMHGNLNTEADIWPEESAGGIIQQIFAARETTGPVYIDYLGKPLQW